jgi:hypothetical protein
VILTPIGSSKRRRLKVYLVMIARLKAAVITERANSSTSVQVDFKRNGYTGPRNIAQIS